MTDTTRITGEVPQRSGGGCRRAHRHGPRHCQGPGPNCRSATTGGGRALVVKTVIGEVGQPDLATLSDMGMLCVTGGIERDLAEFDTLFAASGWQRGETYPVAIVPAASARVPKRPMGQRTSRLASTLGSRSRISRWAGVSIGPNSTELTRTPLRAR
jgi:hypothetical protein